MNLSPLAKPIGWFSLALGAAELIAPREIAWLHGTPRGAGVVKAFGAREVAAGAAVLAWPRSPAPFLMRAAGDVLDIAAATIAVREARGAARKTAMITLATVVGFLALDLLVARDLARR